MLDIGGLKTRSLANCCTFLQKLDLGFLVSPDIGVEGAASSPRDSRPFAAGPELSPAYPRIIFINPDEL